MATPTFPLASSSNLLQALKDLDKGILNHTRWLKRIHGSLICSDKKPNKEDMREDAHCRCQFGQWYYSTAHPELDDLHHFTNIGGLHKSMHDAVRDVLQDQVAGSPITSSGYDAFIDQAIQFKMAVRRLQHEIIQQVCVIDPLTGVWNRQSMFTHLSKEHERVRRNNSPCTLCMLDIDHFKQVNDTYGHTIGDRILRDVTERCQEHLRSYDAIFRYGGEEFLICIPDLDTDSATIIIERLRKSIAGKPFSLDNGTSIVVTASFGVTSLSPDKNLDDSIIEADHALLCAKTEGRNCICSWEE